eukprot:4358047-Pyramimonas_sp.AAC.1
MDFVVRRDAQLSRARSFGLELPDPVTARFLREVPQLTDQMKLNLRTLMGNDVSSQPTKSTPLKLDAPDKSALPKHPAPGSMSFHMSEQQAPSDSETELNVCEVEFLGEEAAELPASLEAQGAREDEAFKAFAEIADNEKRS